MALAGTRVWHFLKPTLPCECAGSTLLRSVCPILCASGARGGAVCEGAARGNNIHGKNRTSFAIFITLLPVRDGTVRPEVGLCAGSDGFGYLSDLGKLLVVQFYTQAGAIVGIEFAFFEVQTLGQVG
jgi:hypothetical protein